MVMHVDDKRGGNECVLVVSDFKEGRRQCYKYPLSIKTIL